MYANRREECVWDTKDLRQHCGNAEKFDLPKRYLEKNIRIISLVDVSIKIWISRHFFCGFKILLSTFLIFTDRISYYELHSSCIQ